MNEETENFWPVETLIVEDPTPVLMLKQQAEMLRGLHGGEIEGRIKMTTEEGTVYYSLSLKADALGNYLYKLLDIAYPALRSTESVYPITAQTTSGASSVQLRNDDEFRAWLRDQLSSEFVKRAISNLLRYIRDRRTTTQPA